MSEVTKLADIVSAELSKTADAKKLEAALEQVAEAQNNASNELFAQTRSVSSAKKNLAVKLAYPGSSLQDIIEAKAELAAEEKLLADMTALNSARF